MFSSIEQPSYYFPKRENVSRQVKIYLLQISLLNYFETKSDGKAFNIENSQSMMIFKCSCKCVLVSFGFVSNDLHKINDSLLSKRAVFALWLKKVR